MSSAPKVYIDGHAGTTGLRIRDWMAERTDVELLTIPEPRRKDPEVRREFVLGSDLAVLCLPDEAAREAAGWAAGAECADGGTTRVLDASTAHRVADGWTYGLPELAPERRQSIKDARFVANPGCYSSAFVLLARPLVDAGLIAPDTPLAIHAVSGYSGGGRALIERWEGDAGPLEGLPYEAPYALERIHKHIPEMLRYSGLTTEPQFVPAVGRFRCGMRVQVPVNAAHLTGGATGRRVWEAIEERYRDEPFIVVARFEDDDISDESALDPRACNDTNEMVLRVIAHPSGHVLLIAILDNLGKGASGAAIQNLNLMLGLDEATGLPARVG